MLCRSVSMTVFILYFSNPQWRRLFLDTRPPGRFIGPHCDKENVHKFLSCKFASRYIWFFHWLVIGSVFTVYLPSWYDNFIDWADHEISWFHMMTSSNENFPRYWPFVRGIHRSPAGSPHKGQWRGSLMFSLVCGWTNGWVNSRDSGDLRRHRAQYDVIQMILKELAEMGLDELC